LHGSSGELIEVVCWDFAIRLFSINTVFYFSHEFQLTRACYFLQVFFSQTCRRAVHQYIKKKRGGKQPPGVTELRACNPP